MPFDVFISHSNKDIAAAEAVRLRIEAEKVRCWDTSRDIPFGANWDQSVIAGLKSCRVMVLIFSSHANQSQQVLDEVKLAYETGLTIMPFRIEDEKPGDDIKPWVSSAQWMDALTPPMERHLDKIAWQVKACIDAMNGKGIMTPVARQPIPVAVPQPSATTPGNLEEEPPAKKGNGTLVITLVLLLIAGAGAGWWFVTKKPAPQVASSTPAPEPYKAPVDTSQHSAPYAIPTPPPVFPPTPHMLEATKENPFINSLGMKFVPVQGTKVLFGIWDTRVRDYRAYSEAKPGVDASWQDPGFKQGDDEPVVNVSWNDAKAFCAWLTQMDRKAGKIGQDEEYRLPTDQEWSAAAGPGKYPWGDQWPPPQGAGNYDPSIKVDGYDHTSPVGSFEANPYGLYSMGGDVWQWCEDWYQPQMNGKALLEEYPDLNDDGIYHVVRGGSWSSGPILESLMCSYRYNGDPQNRDNRYGFRCVVASTPP